LQAGRAGTNPEKFPKCRVVWFARLALDVFLHTISVSMFFQKTLQSNEPDLL
jgi:hypothetical protein